MAKLLIRFPSKGTSNTMGAARPKPNAINTIVIPGQTSVSPFQLNNFS
jgi:hypothetical protein